MEFKVVRQDLLTALSQLMGVVERKSTMPILANFLLKAEAGSDSIVLWATDLETAIETRSVAVIRQSGTLTLPARKVYDILKELPDAEILFKQGERPQDSNENATGQSHDSDWLLIRTGSSSFHVPYLPVHDFPKFVQVQGEGFQIPSALISQFIEKTSFSMSPEDTRMNLAGALLELDGEQTLRMVTTDGHRLSLCEQRGFDSSTGPFKIIIPRRGIQELRKFVESRDVVSLKIDPRYIEASHDRGRILIRLISGDFPDYDRVIPKSFDQSAKFPRERLVSSLRRVSLMANERSKAVLLSLSPGLLEVSIQNPEAGQAREEFDIDFRGNASKIAFNARYVLDVLEALGGETVQMDFRGDLPPCLLRSPHLEGQIYIIMPMRI
jgi:DNA polymerase-3 subunit beta